MTITTLTSREFNQETSKAKKAARNGPVIVTDRGRASHVLLTIEEYRRLTGTPDSLIDLLAMPDAEAVDFEPPRLDAPLAAPAELD
jgi:prevent-host-death family protein